MDQNAKNRLSKMTLQIHVLVRERRNERGTLGFGGPKGPPKKLGGWVGFLWFRASAWGAAGGPSPSDMVRAGLVVMGI
jgi:hypothetical protein